MSIIHVYKLYIVYLLFVDIYILKILIFIININININIYNKYLYLIID